MCNAAFVLPVKTNSDEDPANSHCNRAVFPADSWEEHPSTNICKPSNRFQTYPKSEPIHHVPEHIFIWSESYPVFTSDDAFGAWHRVTGCFNQMRQRDFSSFFFNLCLFHLAIMLTCWHVLLCPVASCDISADMITANGFRRDWVTGNAIFRLYFTESVKKKRNFVWTHHWSSEWV